MAKNNYWIVRLDRLKERMSWTDVALAKRLDISPAMLGHVRASRRPLPAGDKVRLLDALGYQMSRDLLFALLPRPARQALTEADNLRSTARLAPVADPEQDMELPSEDDD